MMVFFVKGLVILCVWENEYYVSEIRNEMRYVLGDVFCLFGRFLSYCLLMMIVIIVDWNVDLFKDWNDEFIIFVGWL